MNFSGMRRMSTNAASGIEVRASSAAPKRPLCLATLPRHDGAAVRAGRHGHNALMTGTKQSANAATTATRMGVRLLGIGTLHFVAPKPFDTIVPAELPGTPRFYTYASGIGELGTGALLLMPGTRRLGGLAA